MLWKNPNVKKGFTLVELMVVISIISLLSSVTLAGLNTAREKARVSAALQFATSVDHFLGADAVGIWRLDEGSGVGPTVDTSGYNNHAIFENSPTWTAGVTGTGIDLSNSSHLRVPNNARLNFGAGNFTISAWFKTTNTSNFGIVVHRGAGVGGWSIQGEGNRLLFACYCNVTGGHRTENVSFRDGRWHHLTFTRLGESVNFYLDGRKLAMFQGGSGAGGDFITENFDYRFGADATPGPADFLEGQMDDVRIYAAAIP